VDTFFSDRLFRVYDFNSNHGQLIIRADQELSDDSPTRIEIYFGNVSYMAVRSYYRGIVIRKPGETESVELAERFGLPPSARPHIHVVGEGLPVGVVVSGRPAWREARRRVDDPSLFHTELAPDVVSGTIDDR
jgi:hypothetical protein